jgi:hypothetical protein
MRFRPLRVAALTLAAVIVAAPLVLVVDAGPASAASWRDPIDPYPDLPSQQYKTAWVQASGGSTPVFNYMPGSMGFEEEQAQIRARLAQNGYPAPSDLSGAKVQAQKASKVERLIFDGAPTSTPNGKPVNISSLPKAITGPAKFARGAAGGPLGLAFAGGFAVGEAGVLLYGVATGNDPLPGVCGSGFAGLAGFMYMGIMPDCAAGVTDANADATAGVQPLTYGTGSIVITGTFMIGTQGNTCMARSGTLVVPSGAQFQILRGSTGLWGSASPPATGNQSYCTNAGLTGHPYAVLPITGMRWINTTTQQVFAEAKMGVADPLRTPGCRITWDDNSTTTGAGTPYQESEGFPLSAGGLGCKQAWQNKPGAGTQFMPRDITVESDGGDGTRQEIMRQPIPELDQDEKNALNDTTGKGLQLFKGTESCLTFAADCAGWWAETDNGQALETEYRCTFGDNRVALSQCYVYAQTFEADQETPTITDPATGEPKTWTGTGDLNSTAPTTGPNPGDACMTSWAAVANPVEWVLHPVKCALVWAFVPRNTVVDAHMQKGDENWRGSTPGRFATAIAGVGASLDGLGGTDCGGIIVPVPDASSWPTVQTTDRAMLAACPGDFFHPFAPWFYWAISGGILIAAFFAIRGNLDKFVGNT